MVVVELSGPARDLLTVYLRPITGADELLVDNADPNTAMMLLGRLAKDGNGKAVDLGHLTLSQTDRLLSALYNNLYGSILEKWVSCSLPY